VRSIIGGRVLTTGGWEDRMIDVGGAGPVFDVGGRRVGPGYVDLQINGGWGIDLQAEPERLWELGARLPEIGVTAFLPTLTTNGSRRLDAALDAWATGRPGGYVGAEPLGWHLEGPWLAPSKRGAHRADLLAAIPAALPPCLDPAHGVRLVTLAPELDGADAAIAELRRRGVGVSLGHSAIAMAGAEAAFSRGAGMGTHLFNAMSGLHHREPGLAAALLMGTHRPAIGLIADGEHVDPVMVDLAWRLAGDRIVLVSDAVAPLGLTDRPVMRLADGTLAGAVVGLDRGVANLARFTGCADHVAHAAASTRPAAVLGIDARLGAGERFDAVVVESDGSVYATIIDGVVVHRS
jgi:N-acetylglucosamine-6-phosphate deacetylase